MRKSINFKIIIFIMFTAGLIAGPAASIKITTPKNGENWKIGEKKTINWTSSGISENVRLKLYRGGASLGPIVKSWPNSGSYPWKIPSTMNGQKLTTATNYRVRIETISESHSNWSDGNFTISAPVAAFIKIDIPNGGENWRVGDKKNITWTSKGISENVRIKLYRGGTSLGPIVKSRSNSGSHPWKIPSTLNGHQLTPAPNYKIRIETISAKYNDWGDGYFTISKSSGSSGLTARVNRGGQRQDLGSAAGRGGLSLAGQKIKFYSPKTNHEWKPMTDYSITWEAQKAGLPMSGFWFDVKLVSADNNYFKDITIKKGHNYVAKDTKTSRIYSIKWKFHGSMNIPAGNYQISVASVSLPQLKAKSGIFKINNTISSGTGFIGEPETDLKIEKVFYDDFKKTFFVRIKNHGYSPFNDQLTIDPTIKTNISTFKDPQCPANGKFGGVINLKKFSLNRFQSKTVPLFKWKCFDRRPSDFLPRTGPVKFEVRISSNYKLLSYKSGLICKTSKADIIVSSWLFFIGKSGTQRINGFQNSTISPNFFNWISKNKFTGKISVTIRNWGCQGINLNWKLYMDGPYLNGKKEATLGTLNLGPGQEKNVTSKTIQFSIPQDKKFRRILLVAYPPEARNEGYQDAYKNNFILAHIRIFRVSNTVRGR